MPARDHLSHLLESTGHNAIITPFPNRTTTTTMLKCGLSLTCTAPRAIKNFDRLSHSMSSIPISLMEEQTLSQYRQKRYYPVKIGDTFNGRYQIITKLGYGAYSTVWLARDERLKDFKSLKICVQDTTDSPILNEVTMLQHIAERAKEMPDHVGIQFTCLAEDVFKVDGPSGRHYCIVSKPHAGSVRSLQEIFPNAVLPKLLVRSLMHRVLVSLNFLHLNCGVVHTDVTPMNILTQTEGDALFQELEEDEVYDPSMPIMDGNVPIYRKRFMAPELSGLPVLTDFGQMRYGEPPNNEWWMPDLYRAPEVLLQLPWGYPVDIWSVGVMMLELLEGKNLFDPMDRINNQYVLPLALAQYITYLGPPPLEIIKQSPLFSTYFDSNGNWVSEPAISNTSFEDFVTVIPPGEEKDLFLRFIRRILTWDPEARLTANEAFADDWMMRPNEDML